MGTGSWLFPEDVDRERMLDMDERLQPVRRVALSVLAVALLACGPWLGWWTLAPLGLAALGFGLADRSMDRLEHPEYAIFAAWAASETIIAASVAITGGIDAPTTAWLAIPLVTLAARFSLRGIAVGVAYTLALLVAMGLALNAHAIVHDPPLLIAPAALLLAVAILSTALMSSDREHRTEAVIDALTGMLNRNALAARTFELAEQSRLTGAPVGAILADIDHFKRINDAHGHSAGDAVLTDVGYLLRKELRAFDLAYRLGGEEFLVLVPGAGIAETAALAERLRRAVAARPVAGQRITMSFGVSASPPGSGFDYQAVIAEADAALYEAKRGGRNRLAVRRVEHPTPVIGADGAVGAPVGVA